MCAAYVCTLPDSTIQILKWQDNVNSLVFLCEGGWRVFLR